MVKQKAVYNLPFTVHLTLAINPYPSDIDNGKWITDKARKKEKGQE